MTSVRLRTTISFTINATKENIFLQNAPTPLLSCPPPVTLRHRRSLHTQQLTKHIQYISTDNTKLKLDANTLKLNNHSDKPLCVIMNWMMARPKHVARYAELYTSVGFDAVAVSCSPWQLTWPARGSQVIGRELLKFLEANEHRPLVVHGFSVGAYVWSELLVHTTRDKPRHLAVLERIKAQVWDSPADIHEIPVGFPSAVFPTNKLLQETFRLYIKTHMNVFYGLATQHYMRGSEVFYASPCKAPGLFLVSKTDPVGVAHRSREVADLWEKMGIKCNFKCWERSPHVQHYMHHPDEYKAAVYSHLHQCGVIPEQHAS